jgi:hemerythrin-like domain-containing protein
MENFMRATQQLINEHQGITLMLDVMRNITDSISAKKELNAGHLENIINFLKVFIDQCHHGKEEKLLFPAMVDKGVPKEGGPIAVMLHEHAIGRTFIKKLSTAFDEYKAGEKNALLQIANAMNSYIALLTNHIFKENNVLFPMADRVLPDQEQLYDKFEKLEKEEIGHGRHEEFHQLLNHLKQTYLR